MNLQKDVQFLFEMGSLRLIQRSWRRFLNSDAQSITEHTFRVIWTSLIIATLEKKGDHEKIIKMALVHDISESRCGDVDYVSREYTGRDEKKAMEDLLNESSLKNEFMELWEEYEKKESIESKIVKDADNLDVQLELSELESTGSNLRKIWKEKRNKSVYPKMYTAAGKKLWKEIEKANPHDWHLKTRNRFTVGDWKEK